MCPRGLAVALQARRALARDARPRPLLQLELDDVVELGVELRPLGLGAVLAAPAVQRCSASVLGGKTHS